jgi:hypothetical protein
MREGLDNMAKLVMTFEDGIVKRELTFRDKTYDFSMIPDETGSHADKYGFDVQVLGNSPDSDHEELGEILDFLSSSDEDDTLGLLEQLEEEFEAGKQHDR